MNMGELNIGTLEGAVATAIVMAVGWLLQYRKTRVETNKVKEEVNALNQQNATLKAKADNEMIDVWRKQLEDNNNYISKLISSNDIKDKQIEDLKDALVEARDELREAKREIKEIQLDLDNSVKETIRLRRAIEKFNIRVDGHRIIDLGDDIVIEKRIT